MKAMINSAIIEAIYSAAHGNITLDQVDHAVESMNDNDMKDFMKLVRVLTIMNGCQVLMDNPANHLPV